MEFIKKIHLFRGLSDEELFSVASRLKERTFYPGDEIIREGEEANHFFIIYSGKVILTRKHRRGHVKIAELGNKDSYGEDALLRKIRRIATATAASRTMVLTLSRPDFDELTKQINGLRTRVELLASSHKLMRNKHFPWLEEGEVIYYISRKHPILLLKNLTWPVLGLLLPAFFLLIYLFNPAGGFFWLGIVLFLLVCGWIFLACLDWSNDYYIVTNRRVIYLEKVILIYDSRQEAPLTAILSVHTVSDILGRALIYGDVNIRTFVGNIIFATIGHPEEVEALVRDYWDRSKELSNRENVEAMKHTIRQKLGIEPPGPVVSVPAQAPKPGNSFTMFKIRFEEKGVITYRKHWIVLIKQTWLPGTLLFLSIALIIRDFLINGLIHSDSSLSDILIFLSIPLFLWWLYQAVDWSNDKFQVTDEEIFDLDKTPLGKMKKNVAPLNNILNTEARREGFLEVVFNYGDVHISTGGLKMVFEDVMNPAAVQQDIDQRRMARRDKQEQTRTLAERERLAEFFATYHKNAEIFNNELETTAKHKPIPPAEGNQSEVK